MKQEEAAKAEEAKNNEASSSETAKQKVELTLDDVVGAVGFSFSYEGYELDDSYPDTGEETYFAMNATAGKTFLAVHINLKATGGDVECDMLAKNLKYRVVINGDKTVAAQTSILLNDLGTYQGTIAGGSAQECVLLFETEKQNVENITSLQLKVSDGSTSTVSELQ